MQDLARAFSMKDLGPLHFFSDIEVFGGRDGMFLSQRKYSFNLLVHASMHQCKPISTPLASKNSSLNHDDEPFKGPTYLCSVVGVLQ